MDSSATNQRIAWFKKEESGGFLDLTPQFQRRPVWTDEQSAYLIDTILSGLPIPEVYIRSRATPTGDVRSEVVDGQQRIRSVLLFGSNDLVLTGKEVAAKWQGKTIEDLTEDERTTFWEYKIVVRDVSGASDTEIRDLFRRLNIHSVVLNDQELRHARYSGRFIRAMERLADDPWWLDTGIVNVRQIRRMEDVEYISELFLGLLAGPQDKKKGLDDYYETFDSSMPHESDWVGRFERVRDFIRWLFPPAELRGWSGKSDFYTLFLALAPLAANAPPTLIIKKRILAALDSFRKDVDIAKRKDNERQFADDVHAYAEAVTRAATDLGRRMARLEILEGRLATATSTSGATLTARLGSPIVKRPKVAAKRKRAKAR
jgi:hypothetical protein